MKIGIYNDTLMVGEKNRERFEEWLEKIQSDKQIRIIEVIPGWGILLYENIEGTRINKNAATRFSDIDIVSPENESITPEEAHFIKGLLLVDIDTFPDSSKSFDKSRRDTLYNKICNIEKGN